jgi:predicted transcriptional regulator
MGEWKFVTNHAMVLCLIAQQPRITAREIASTIGITEKTTRNIIDDYITKTKEGRRIRYGIDPKMPLRHEIHDDKVIGDLIKVLSKGKRRQRVKSAA